MNLRKKRVSRRQRLLEIGQELFSQYTYEEVAIDDIADRAEISKGLLYYYFPTKHDFYVAVVREAARQLLEMTDPDPLLTPIERLRVGLLAYFTYVEQYARAYISLLRGGVGVDTEIAAILDEVRQSYTRRILASMTSDKMSSPLLLLAVNGWVGYVEALSITWLKERPVEKEMLCELAIATLLTTLQHARTADTHA